MISKEYIELINKDIDRAISPEEQEKLHNYLLINPEAKTYYEDLQLLSDYIDRVPEPSHPAGLSKRIINSINFNKFRQESRKITTPFFSFINLKLWAPRLGYMVAGIFIGIFIYAALGNNSAFNEEKVKGTIGIENKRVENLKAIKLDDKDISGTVNLMKAGDSFWFDVDLNSLKPFELNINYQDEVELVDFSPNTLSFTKKNNTLEFPKSSGSQHFTIYFSKMTEIALLNFQVTQSGIVLINQKFQVN